MSKKDVKNFYFIIMELKDWLNSINFTKEDLPKKSSSYHPYIVKRTLYGDIECVMFANELNMHNLIEKELPTSSDSQHSMN